MHEMDRRSGNCGTLASRSQHVALAICVSVALVGLLATCFKPTWESNDDVGMSMIAHGYGFIAHGSPNLLFSNVIWGHIVRAMPQFGNIVGYTVATALAIVVACASTLYFLMRLRVQPIIAILAAALIFIWPVLFPQFTLNAGLLAIAAVLGWRAYAETGEVASLVLGCVLGFFSYLIRNQEFWLVLAVSLPFYPWKTLARNRGMQVALVLLGMSIAGAGALDKAAYDTNAWNAYHEFNLARAPYTDFRAGEQVNSRPDILTRHGYSTNDINLISNWFFVDPQLSNPAKLNAMLTDVGIHHWVSRGFGLGMESVRLLYVDQLWPMLACALIIGFVSPSRRVFMVAALIIGAVFALGAIGRPGVTRVNYPLCALLLLTAVHATRARPPLSRGIAGLAVLLAGAATLHAVWPYQAQAKSNASRAELQVEGLPKGVLTIWGADFPFEVAFPPLGGTAKAQALRIYPMGVSTLAPYSMATEEEAAGRGFLKRLTSEAGLNISLTAPRIEMLRTYCEEHLQAPLEAKVVYEREGFLVHNLRCSQPTLARETRAAADH